MACAAAPALLALLTSERLEAALSQGLLQAPGVHWQSCGGTCQLRGLLQ